MPLPRWLLIIICGCAPLPVAAQVVIIEIAAYERTDHEWVEIYNASSAAVDLTGWKFWENATNHGLSALQGSATLGGGGYAIIAQKGDVFLADRPGFAGTVLDSSWGTLKESGEEIGLKDDGGNFVERFTYLPSPDTALERLDPRRADYSDANWKPHASSGTPGQANSRATAGTTDPPQPPPPAPATVPPELTPTPAPSDPPPPPPPRYSRQVVVNEFLADPGPGGQEWVELYNAGSLPAKLDGWKLQEGSGGKRSLNGELAAGGFLVVEPAGSLNNRGDRLLLLDDGNVVVNEVSFGDWDDGARTDNAPPGSTGQSVARTADGGNTGNHADDFRTTTTPTPGSSNRIAAPPPASPAPSPPAAPTPSPAPAPLSPSPSPTVPPRLIGGAATTLHLLPGDDASLPSALAASATPQPTPAREGTTVPTPAPQRKRPAGRVLGQTRVWTVAQARAAPAGTHLTVVGTVLTPPGTLARQYFYLSDATGSLQVYQHRGDFPELAAGDQVEITGTTSAAEDEPRLKVSAAGDLRVLNTGEPPHPLDQQVANLSATSSGTLVALEGEVTAARGRSFTLDDGSGELTIALWRDADGDALPLVGARGSVTGVLLAQRGTLRLRPRGPADLALRLPLSASPSPDRSPLRWYLGATTIAAIVGLTGWMRIRRRTRAPPAGGTPGEG